MTDFADVAVQTLLGVRSSPATLAVALLNGTVEVADSGYRRQQVPAGRWKQDGDGWWWTEVTFGPFTNPVSFDGDALYDGTDQLDSSGFTSRVELPARSTYTHRYMVRGAS